MDLGNISNILQLNVALLLGPFSFTIWGGGMLSSSKNLGQGSGTGLMVILPLGTSKSTSVIFGTNDLTVTNGLL